MESLQDVPSSPLLRQLEKLVADLTSAREEAHRELGELCVQQAAIVIARAYDDERADLAAQIEDEFEHCEDIENLISTFQRKIDKIKNAHRVPTGSPSPSVAPDSRAPSPPTAHSAETVANPPTGSNATLPVPAQLPKFQIADESRGGAYTLLDNEGKKLPHGFPPSALISLSTHPTFEQESYEIDKIIDHEETDKGMRYLVRWKNYSPEEDSWEPEDCFDDYGVIHQYWSRQEQAAVGPGGG
jgi:hypothetical protein